MININDIIETALAVDALQTHVSTDAIGVDARLRPAMERCAPAALAAVYAVSADADASAARAEFYADAAAEYADNVRDLAGSGCPASHAPSWT